MYASYFSTAVVKHYDQGTLWKKEFIYTSGSKGLVSIWAYGLQGTCFQAHEIFLFRV